MSWLMETGAFRELNAGPLAPKARIIPLEQMPLSALAFVCLFNEYLLAHVALLCKKVNGENTWHLGLEGPFRESNSGPLRPEARIIPLDQMPLSAFCFLCLFSEYLLARGASVQKDQWGKYTAPWPGGGIP